MNLSLGSRVRKAWDVFMNRSPTYEGDSSSYYRRSNAVRSVIRERTILNSVLTRIAIDCAAIDIKHARLDENGRYLEDMDSGLNECLTVSANLDQSARAFIQDVVMSLLDEGVVAVVPVETNQSLYDHEGFDIYSLRVGKITNWNSYTVDVELYNERIGRTSTLRLPKNKIAIIENPLYSVMNERNSTLQRLTRTLDLLDVVGEQSGSGKLDLIFQLPYSVRSETRREQADKRRKDIEDQLAGSKFGVAYIDSTEKVTQLNRPLENNLMAQAEYLTTMLYGQLGITKEIMDGTASDTIMLNYYNRTTEPIVAAIVDEMNRKFLTKTARSQRQKIMSFRDPFALVPINNIAEIADKFTRNEIMSSNEVRQIIGMKPSDDPKADELRNSNLSQPTDQTNIPDGLNPGGMYDDPELEQYPDEEEEY